MASRILRGESSVSWASRTDGSPSSMLSASPPQARKQSRAGGSPQSPIASRCSKEGPLTNFTSSEHRPIEELPIPISSSERERSGVRSPVVHVHSYPDRQSAPARLGPSPPREFSYDLPTPRFSLGGENCPRPIASVISKASSSADAMPAKDIVLDRSAPARAVRNHMNTEDSKGGKSPLQPVQEENPSSGGDGEDEPQPTKRPGLDLHGGGWGETFKVEWLCTQRLPFQRLRHLRNAWNHDREIKVSRDGTELEPGIGQRLIDDWMTLAAGEGEGSRQSTAKPSAKSTPGIRSTPAEPATKGNEQELS